MLRSKVMRRILYMLACSLVLHGLALIAVRSSENGVVKRAVPSPSYRVTFHVAPRSPVSKPLPPTSHATGASHKPLKSSKSGKKQMSPPAKASGGVGISTPTYASLLPGVGELNGSGEAAGGGVNRDAVGEPDGGGQRVKEYLAMNAIQKTFSSLIYLPTALSKIEHSGSARLRMMRSRIGNTWEIKNIKGNPYLGAVLHEALESTARNSEFLRLLADAPFSDFFVHEEFLVIPTVGGEGRKEQREVTLMGNNIRVVYTIWVPSDNWAAVMATPDARVLPNVLGLAWLAVKPFIEKTPVELEATDRELSRLRTTAGFSMTLPP